jgi:uncharacterized membrane protein
VPRPLIILALASASLVWLAAITTAPVAAAPRVAAVTYMAGSLICHQQSDRSFHYGTAQFPVCARCYGLYGGGVVGVLSWAGLAGIGAARRRAAARWTSFAVVRGVLIVAAVPTVATVALAWIGWDASNAVRAILAIPLGVAIAAVVTAVAAGDLR